MNNDKWKSEGPDNELPFVIFHWSSVICHFLSPQSPSRLSLTQNKIVDQTDFSDAHGQ